MECALFRKDYDCYASACECVVEINFVFMECALFRKDYDKFPLLVRTMLFGLYGMCLV